MQQQIINLSIIKLFDAQGKQLITKYSSNQQLLEIDITQSAKGNYLVQVRDGEILQTESFIRQYIIALKKVFTTIKSLKKLVFQIKFFVINQ